VSVLAFDGQSLGMNCDFNFYIALQRSLLAANHYLHFIDIEQ
jgi:hypothetical protein